MVIVVFGVWLVVCSVRGAAVDSHTSIVIQVVLVLVRVVVGSSDCCCRRCWCF